MNMKWFSNLVILLLGGLYGCVPIRPIYVSPAPSPFYHKESGVVGGAIMPLVEPEKALWVSGEYLRWKNKEANIDMGVLPHVVLSDDVNSGNVFLYMRRWFGTAKAENPWGNLHGGLQLAVNNYGVSKDSLEFPVHFELGFSPGIFRKRFNVAFPLRVGIGTLFTQRSTYMYAGPGIQGSFNLSSRLVFQTQFNFTLGIGASDKAFYLPIPALITLGIHYKF
ncbi:MAG TPA: hypothetical protein PLD12_02680 [Bacteroidales bacterium]|nr:hypothetical protein [Bacteroidales bacterium]HOK98020.1 hypothetical protein [Bacteroidales bacterium]HPO65945.1 hypothetical protein [Bacteroidales bacterium]